MANPRKKKLKKKRPVPVSGATSEIRARASEGLSPIALANQLDKANETITRLRTERNAWAARAGAEIRLGRPVNYPGDRRTQSLLDRVAGALLLADYVSDARQGLNVSDGPGRISQGTTTPDPGASTRVPRHHAVRLRSAIADALATWDTAVVHEFDPPQEAKIPKVRCRVRTCAALDDPVPAWRVKKNGSTVPTERCSSCGNPIQPPTDKETP